MELSLYLNADNELFLISSLRLSHLIKDNLV